MTSLPSATGDAATRIVSAAEVHALSVTSLGLDAALLDLEAPEALAALVRRAASFSAPCPPRLLRVMVLRALRGLVDVSGERERECRTVVDETIEALTSYGDLLELPTNDTEGADTRVLYLAPPTFVALDGIVFLIGDQLDGADPLPSHLREQVEYRGHTRRLRPEDQSDVAQRLRAIGWIELGRDLWLAAPQRWAPDELLGRYNVALSAAAPSGEVPGLSVLVPDTSTSYYSGRWSTPDRRSGRFVARRVQRYGADLWCYVELSSGDVTKLIDFVPDARSGLTRPCDAAWHLQMAIDTLRGQPQTFRLRPVHPKGSVIIDFFSPVPLWARRRWDVLGEEISRDRSLFAYRFPEAEFSDVRRTLERELWLRERIGSSA